MAQGPGQGSQTISEDQFLVLFSRSSGTQPAEWPEKAQLDLQPTDKIHQVGPGECERDTRMHSNRETVKVYPGCGLGGPYLRASG